MKKLKKMIVLGMVVLSLMSALTFSFNEKKYHFVLSVFSMVVVLYMTVRK